MIVTDQQQKAIRMLGATPEGKMLLECLQDNHRVDCSALVMAGPEDQMRRLQGVCRRNEELMNLLKSK